MTQALDTLNGLMVFELGAGLAAVLGVLGLILAVIGVYGVISYWAAQRTQEIGMRMAPGARPADVLWMVLRHGSIVVAGGLVLGLFAIVALAACYIPARRSTTVDPIAALRQ